MVPPPEAFLRSVLRPEQCASWKSIECSASSLSPRGTDDGALASAFWLRGFHPFRGAGGNRIGGGVSRSLLCRFQPGKKKTLSGRADASHDQCIALRSKSFGSKRSARAVTYSHRNASGLGNLAGYGRAWAVPSVFGRRCRGSEVGATCRLYAESGGDSIPRWATLPLAPPC